MKRRKIQRGKPLDENLTKGSMEYALSQIRKAFYAQHASIGDEWMYIAEIFDDHVIIFNSGLKESEYYYVAYTVYADEFDFATRADWEIVELTYRPQTIVERMEKLGGQQVSESIQSTAVRIDEAVKGQPRIIHMDVAQANVINGNGNRYSTAVLQEAVAEARLRLHEAIKHGRFFLLGESEHPSAKRQGARLEETIVKWTDIWFDNDGWVRATGEMIENIAGRDAIVTMDAGVLPGGSLRGFGDHTEIVENGRQVREIEWLRFVGIDLVMSPSFADAAVTQLESLNGSGEDGIMSIKDKTGDGQLTIAQLRAKYPDLVNEIAEGVRDETELEEARQAKKDFDAKMAAEEAAAERDAGLRAALGVDDNADLEAAVAERG